MKVDAHKLYMQEVVSMGPSRHILLVDDEAYVTTVLSDKFTNLGDEVQVAADGEAGLAMAFAKSPDVIVTDYQMPLLSGYDMAVRLRNDARTQNVPVIMLTARGHHLSPQQLAMTNIKCLLNKPFSAREVLAKAQEITGQTFARGAA
jgi:two-component system phosphate regulon response regulator PhoB